MTRLIHIKVMMIAHSDIEKIKRFQRNYRINYRREIFEQIMILNKNTFLNRFIFKNNLNKYLWKSLNINNTLIKRFT